MRTLIVGRGRMGTALAHALPGAELAGRGATGAGADLVLLAVPDSAIAEAAALVVPGPLVAHLSGATGLAPLGDRETFSLHPLLAVTGPGTPFAGAFAALDGTSPHALAAAESLAERLGLRTFRVSEANRVTYHAAASVAANFLVTVEDLAERLAATAGVPREALVPLAHAALSAWAHDGAAALTGPISRGDDATVAAQRAALAARTAGGAASSAQPAGLTTGDLDLFDALTAATRALAGRDPEPLEGDTRVSIIRTIDELREALRDAASIGFVPTMGALHEGHLSLIRAARAENERVVVSVFVNPTQFNDPADLAAYPRTEERDAQLAAEAGADLVFVPSAAEIYPDGHATSVHIGGPVTEVLEGASRPGHFDGVATVVTKLLIATGATRAYFGQKDAQQLLVVQRLVRDLRLPTEIVPCPTSREDDGLARSSRNSRLSAPDRSRALAIPRALSAATAAVAAGETRAAVLVELVTGVLADAGLTPEYVAIVDTDTLADRVTLDTPSLCAIAVQVGDVRLIDNEILVPVS